MIALAAGLLAVPAPAAAHCDHLDGPVVAAARSALALGRVEPALAWVRAEDEAEIRSAFARTLEVRRTPGSARELADLWFFETLVRVHRMGEGEPYTGLQPAGTPVSPGIAAADRALATATVEALADRVAGELAEAVRARAQELAAMGEPDPLDVEANRRRVRAYADFVHFVEALHGLAHGGGEGHAHPTG